jgi:hypothetical protein
MKLSCSILASLVQKATPTATVDGHYGAFLEIDWTATFTEVATTTTA